MSGFGTWSKIINPLASTSAAFGGEWGNLVSDLFNGVDISLTDVTKTPKIGTPFKFKLEKLRLYDGDESHEVTFSVDDIDTGPLRKIRIRRMNTPFETDFMVLESLTQELINKTINADNNTLSNIENMDIKTGAGITDNKLAQITNKAKLPSDSVYKDDSTVLKNKTLNFTTTDGNVSTGLHNDVTKEKWGRFYASKSGEIIGEGILEGMQSLGTVSNTIDATGSGNSFATEASISNASSGIAKILPVGTFLGWMRLNFLPISKFEVFIPARTSNDSRFLHGWWTGQTLLPASDTSPMSTTNGGILIGYNSTDTHIMIYRGPGDGSTSPPAAINTGIAIPNATIAYLFEIIVNSATDVVVNIYNSGSGVLLYTSGTISTDLPSGTKSLNFHLILQNTGLINKVLTIYSGDMWTIK